MNIPPSLDPDLFRIVPHVAVVDEFLMLDDDGEPIANLTPAFLGRLCDHMNQRESDTGDLAPLVIAHNPSAGTVAPVADEANRLLGFARNWSVGPLFDTGRQAGFADFWFYLDKVDTARNLPRRSAEVWAGRYEIDPIALLGPTTPARDLGLLKLSRNGSLTVTMDGPLMPDDKANAELEKVGSLPIFQEILGALKQLLAAQTTPPPPAPGAPPSAGGEQEPSDEEIEQMLASMGKGGEPAEGEGGEEDEEEPDVAKKSRKADKPVMNAGQPGGTDTKCMLQRQINDLHVKLARTQVVGELTKLRAEQRVDVDPADEALIADLIAVPEDIRVRQLQRLAKGKKLPPTETSFGLNHALQNSSDGRPAYSKSEDEKKAVMKLARQKNITYEAAFAEKYGRQIGS